jgi:bacteriocin biosynthesis cyclodehydratase domain-containing protein
MSNSTARHLPPRLYLSSEIRIIPALQDRLFWITGSDQGVFEAPYAGMLAVCLRSESRTSRVLGRLPNSVARTAARASLRTMIESGLVEVSPQRGPAESTHRGLRSASQRPNRNIVERRVTPIVFDKELAGPFTGVLQSTGLKLVARAGLWIVAVKDYLDRRLQFVHLECLPRQRAWMIVKPAGDEIWIGPIFHPPDTVCWACLAVRLREHRWVEAQLFNGQRWPGPILKASSASQVGTAAALAAKEAEDWLAGETSLQNTILSINLKSMESKRHVVPPFPNCPNCSLPAYRRSLRRVRRHLVVWNPSEDLRLTKATETLDRLRILESPITGIVQSLEQAAARSGFTYTCSAFHNLTLPPKDCRLEGAIRMPGTCSGRGWTPEEAEAGCLAEAVERYALQFRGDEERVTATYRDLGEQAIHPAQILLFSEEQYRNRARWNRVHDLNEAVPERFDELEEVEWSEGWSLTWGRKRYLPIALGSLYYRPPAKRWIADADSNGCAAANEMEEAILEGLFELVERDAVSIWWYNRIRHLAFKPDTIEDQRCQAAHQDLQDRGWTVWVLDLTTDLPISVFAAIGFRGRRAWCLGSGAHCFPLLAVRRALCELCQMSSAQIRKGSPPLFTPSGEALRIEVQRQPVQVDLKLLIEDACRKITKVGQEVAIFNLTRREIGFPVIRVVVPGLRHLKPRFAPGRLFDVPVRLGWLPEPRKEYQFPTTRP